ncbi:P-loop containing nucleoside triphosphate hydrolase protein [Apiospora marii]|uniref:P-loop containing nucleoside triphosphate hydrolase protein n=1 Tax=Apiospora marii TaxID=335849 RepID=A0ABR1RLA8_9PEZI
MNSFLAGYLGHGLELPLFRFLDRLSRRTQAALLTAATVGGALYNCWYMLPTMLKPLVQLLVGPFTSTVSIYSSDVLSGDVLEWVTHNVMVHRQPRILHAHTPRDNENLLPRHLHPNARRPPPGPAKPRIVYLPGLNNTWFFCGRRPFFLRASGVGNRHPDDYGGGNGQGVGRQISLLCLGRSVDPIKQFLEQCRRYSQERRKSHVSVHALSLADGSWTHQYKPKRALNTIHLDEQAKMDFLADLETYLDPLTQQFYGDLAIPYQRGYMFWGPPGTGKTSFAIAVAGFLGMPLYVLPLPNIGNDAQLQRIFATVEPRCIVLLEDVDSARIRRDKASDDNNTQRQQAAAAVHGPTLSGLFNVLDGVAAVQNRVVIMTANQPDTLDEALLRPGRVDKRVYFGYITPEVARQMFLRILAPRVFARFYSSSSLSSSQDGGSLRASDQSGIASREESDEMQRLATEVAARIPQDTLTPAQLQEFLLSRRFDRQKALGDIADLVLSCRKLDNTKAGTGKVD